MCQFQYDEPSENSISYLLALFNTSEFSSFKIETCNTSCSGSCHYEEWICLQGLDIVVLSRFPLSHLLVLLLPSLEFTSCPYCEPDSAEPWQSSGAHQLFSDFVLLNSNYVKHGFLLKPPCLVEKLCSTEKY